MNEPDTGRAGESVYRIHWMPGTDLLLGVCFCGERKEFEDPVETWDWLLAHPEASPSEHRPPDAKP